MKKWFPLIPLNSQCVGVLTGFLSRHLHMQAPFVLMPGQLTRRP